MKGYEVFEPYGWYFEDEKERQVLDGTSELYRKGEERVSRRPEITATLSLALEKKINPYNDPRIYWAKEVTFDYSTNHAVRVDYMRDISRLIILCPE